MPAGLRVSVCVTCLCGIIEGWYPTPCAATSVPWFCAVLCCAVLEPPCCAAPSQGLVFDRTSDFPPKALKPALQLFQLLKDSFIPSDYEWLSERFAVAAHKRWLRLAALTDDSLVREAYDAPLSQAPAPSCCAAAHQVHTRL